MKIVNAFINGSDVTIYFDENSIHILNAYQIKDDLKMRGYRFNPQKKSWYKHPGNIDKELAFLRNGMEESTTNSQKESDEISINRINEELPESFSVTQLRYNIENVLKKAIPGNIWIRGIIASDVKNYKWISYFDLRDEDENFNIFFNVEVKKSNLNLINSKFEASGVSEKLEKDLPVFCQVNVRISSKNQVDVRLELIDILPEYTRSKIKNNMDTTVERLKDEKLFHLQKNLKLPELIENIALITSDQGTSVKDIMAGLHPNEKRYNIYFIDSRMEGANAAESIVNAINLINKYNSVNFDLILIARGGGSEQSLNIFNNYEICKNICVSNIPIITAIGHEKDISAAELCSYFTPTPSTPSGLGKYLSSRFVDQGNKLREILNEIKSEFQIIHQRETDKMNRLISFIPTVTINLIKLTKERLVSKLRKMEDFVFYNLNRPGIAVRFLTQSVVRKFKNQINIERNRLQEFNLKIIKSIKVKNTFEKAILKSSLQRIEFNRGKLIFSVNDSKIDDISNKIVTLGNGLIKREEMKLKMNKELSEANSPERILEKGFTIVSDEKGQTLKTIIEFRQSEKKRLKFFDGETFIEEKENKA